MFFCGVSLCCVEQFVSDPCKFILDFLPGQCLEQVSKDVAMLITLCLADAKRRVFHLDFSFASVNERFVR